MRKIRDALRLTFGEGLSRRQVSLSTGIPVTTLVEYVGRAKAAGLSWPVPEDLEDAALEARLYPPLPPSSTPRPVPDWNYVHTELEHKSVTLALLWIEYREQHPDDGWGYSQFCNRYVAWRRHLDVVMRQHHRAGEKMFVDFAGQKIPIYEASGGTVAFYAELFVACLGASSYTYAEAVRSQELLHWVNANTNALEFFQGSPQICVPDNLRSAVTRAHRYEPDVNATFAEWGEHYHLAVIPARPYKARAGLRSTIVTSQLPVEHWHEALGDATIADAVLDRLLEKAHRIELHGESLRAAAAGAPEPQPATGPARRPPRKRS
jgi:transposase